MTGAVWVPAVLAGVCAVATGTLAALLWRSRPRPSGETDERDRLIGELAQARQIARLAEENLQRRLHDKDAACVRMLEEKDGACRRLLEANEAACTRRLEEKEAACRQVLEEKEGALRRKDEDCRRQLAEKDEQCRRVVDEKNAEIGAFLREKEKAFAQTVETLREQFANLAAQTLKLQSADLTALNKTQLESALKPLREQMQLLQETTRKAESDRASLRESFAKNIGAIESVAQGLAKTATALSSDTRVQGRRGEDILAEKLRQAGLEENVSFFLQNGTDRDRPDAQVCDSENRWLVIDSKVSLTAYLDYADLPEGAAKAAKLAAHVASVRQKIDQLAKKKYPLTLGKEFAERNYLPVTAMFVPYEAPLFAALQADPSLWQFAMQNNVVLVTPLTLIAYLRLVYLAWQHEKEARNQAAIVDVARELLARMNHFLLTFEKIGRGIESLQETYAGAKGLLVDAPHAHSIAKAANRLVELHVRLENKKGARIAKAACLKADETEDCGIMNGTSAPPPAAR